MAESFSFELVSPERLVLSEDVVEVVIPASDGQMTVMKDHAPTMTTVKPGLVVVKRADGGEETIFVDGGFADINDNGLSLLAEVAMLTSELDSETLAARLAGAKEAADAAKDDAKDVADLRLSDLEHVKQSLAL
jgi:F-type H+-transporting ATPase subunit epsilon